MSYAVATTSYYYTYYSTSLYGLTLLTRVALSAVFYAPSDVALAWRLGLGTRRHGEDRF